MEISKIKLPRVPNEGGVALMCTVLSGTSLNYINEKLKYITLEDTSEVINRRWFYN